MSKKRLASRQSLSAVTDDYLNRVQLARAIQLVDEFQTFQVESGAVDSSTIEPAERLLTEIVDILSSYVEDYPNLANGLADMKEWLGIGLDRVPQVSCFATHYKD